MSARKFSPGPWVKAYVLNPRDAVTTLGVVESHEAKPLRDSDWILAEHAPELWRVLSDILQAEAGTDPDAKFLAMCNAHKLVAKLEGR